VLVEEAGGQAHGLPEAGPDRQAELVHGEQLQPLGLQRPVEGLQDLGDGVDLVVDAGHQQQRRRGEAADEVHRRPQQHVVKRLQRHLVPEGREQLLGLGHVAGQLGVAGGQGGDDRALAGLEAALGVLLQHGPDRAHLGATVGALQGCPGIQHAGVLAGHGLDPPVDGAGDDGHPGPGAVAPQPEPLGVDLGAGAQVGQAGAQVLDLPFGQPLAARLALAGPDGPVVDGQHHEAGPDQVLGVGASASLTMVTLCPMTTAGAGARSSMPSGR
jgi:hypothetical protein